MNEQPFDLAGPIPTGTSVLEASAGTGKTFAIAHLVLRLVADEGTPLERILVVTFTNAAAAELRERIRLRLAQALSALRAAGAGGALPPESVDPTLANWALTRTNTEGAEAERRLELALAGFDQHRIGTIHSFCQRVLGRYAFDSGADFEAELLEDVEPICRQAAFDFLALRIAANEQALRARPSDVLTIDILTEIARKAIGTPDAVVAPARPETPTDSASGDAEALRLAHGAVASAWRRDRLAIRAVLSDAVSAGAAGRSANLGKPDTWAASFAKVDGFLRAMPVVPKAIPKDVCRLAVGRGEALFKNDTRASWCARFDHGFFAAYADYAEALAKYTGFLEDRELACLHDFVAFARTHVGTETRRARQQTFDDQLRLVERALRTEGGETLVAQIRADVHVALIDEFQDTDPVQWSIFRRLFHDSGRRLLLIGDPKQAIYGFRGADLATYLRARHEANARFSLDVNHRSDAALLRAIEGVYTTSSAPFGAVGTGQDSIAFVHVGAAKPESRVRIGGRSPVPIRLVPDQGTRGTAKSSPDAGTDQADGADGGDGADGADGASDEGLHRIADDVAAFLRSDAVIVEGDRERAVRPGDCAVLVRGHAAASRIQGDLRRLGVAAVIRTDLSVYETAEARELELVLDAALNPSDRRALASALATDLVGAKLGEIGALSVDETIVDRRHEQFRALGASLRERGFARFFREFLALFDIPVRYLGARDGERRVANLHQLGELLHGESERAHLGPDALVTRLGVLRTEKGRADDRRVRLESDADAVSIVTIHVAKGLEWGSIWCASIGKAVKKTSDPAVVTRDAEGVPTLHLLPARDEALCAAIKSAAAAEELRLAYVALTRGRHLVHVHGPKAKTNNDPFGTLFMEGTHESVRIGKAQKGTSGAVCCVPDAAAAALAIEARLAGYVVAARPDDFPAVAVDPAGESDREFATRSFSREAALDTHWRVTSYTGLVGHGTGDRERTRTDEEIEAGLVPVRAEPTVDDTPWGDLPGSKDLGIAVHEALERAPAFDETQLAAQLVYTVSDPRFAALPRLLACSLETPLFEGESMSLSSLPIGSMLREVSFSLPVAGGRSGSVAGTGMTAAALAAVFADHDRPTMPATYATRVARLALGSELRGFLVGAIDLVFEHAGRIYVADYKTTRLGRSRESFLRANLPAAMMERDYTLQALIYALAVHRHLVTREPEYDYETRFGGVMHLFLRAMDPEQGPSCGVYFDRPPLAQLASFERALGIGHVGEGSR